MQTEKIIVGLFLFLTIINVGFEIAYFNTPYWIAENHSPDFSALRGFIIRLVQYLSYIFVIIGAVQLVKENTLRINNYLKFPLYLSFIQSILYYIVCGLSTELSIFLLGQNPDWYFIPLKLMNILFLVLTVYHFLSERKTPTYERVTTKVSKSARFVNRLIDGSLITMLSFSYLETLYYGNIFGEYSFLTTNPYWYIAMNTFIYYFLMEFVFLQTIGKLHNKSFVRLERGRFRSVLLRTIGRFIPFEAFSFFGNKGWHDGLSETSVVTVEAIQEAEKTDDDYLFESFVVEE